MSKNKKYTKNEETPEPATGGSLPEDKPEQVNMAPPVQDAAAKADVLKRGVAMERVDSPRYGVPGQATATRAAAGGGAFNPSAQAGRTPGNPEVRGPGSDPLNKMDIRDELSWNDIGAEQLRTLIDGSPAGFVPDAVLGNFTYEDNLVFQFDNAGKRPGTINSPYRRRVESVSKDQVIFITGQHDSAAKGGMVFYPTKTYAKQGARSIVNVTGGAGRGNFLTRGMTVNISKDGGRYSISSIHFDVDELACSSSADDLDARQDNARVIFDVADRDITETFFELVNKPENLAANKFSPLPDGQPDAIQHLILSRDVACIDGTIAMLACRSAMETYAYHRGMRRQYGAGDGATAQARFMLAERLAQNTGSSGLLWADNVNMPGSSGAAETVGDHNSGWIRLTASEYIQTFLDSPAKYNENFGVWVTQPRGIRLVFEEMQKAFDEGCFAIDKDTYSIIDQCLGWHKYGDKLCGINRFGLVLPMDLNALYEQDDDGNVPTDAAGTIHSKYVYTDYVLNGSFYNKTEVRSVLVDAILQAVKYRILPKLQGADQYNIYIPFDFACDHYSFGQMVLMEAMPYMHQFIHPAKAVFQRFKDMYGVDPVMCDLMQELRLADVMKSSGYKGIGADPSFPEAGEALKLIMATPEVYQAAAMTWDSALELPDALFAIKFTDIAPISDTAEDASQMLFPMLYQTMVLSQWRALKDLGPEKLLRSRDYPIHRYALTGNIGRDDKWATVDSDPRMPFFGQQKPQVYHTSNISGARLELTVGDILRAPRYGGRIAPAPVGLLDFVRAPEAMLVGKFAEYHLQQSGGASSGTTRYGWLADVDDPVILFHEVSGDMVYNGRDIENYRVDFVYMPTFEMSQLGTLLKRYFVHFTSGALTQEQITALGDTYGVWISPDQQSVNQVSGGANFAPSQDIIIPAADGETPGTISISARFEVINIAGEDYSLDSSDPDYVGSEYDTLTVSASGIGPLRRLTISNTGNRMEATVKEQGHAVSMLYENDAMKMWVNDNIFEFVFSPFSGNTDVTLDDNLGEYTEVDHDVTNALIFGFAGYQGLWYDRLDNAIYATKQAAGGRIYSNEILHQNNIFFG